jgi:hypothetical protein
MQAFIARLYSFRLAMPYRLLETNGLCTFYADESDDKFIYTIACVAVPSLMRPGLLSRDLAIEWDNYLDAAKAWHRQLREQFGVPIGKELKGSSIATGRNSYGTDGGRIQGREAFELYSTALSTLNFLRNGSIFSVFATRGFELYGHRKTEAALYALFQRMQKHCQGWRCNALVFFDEGHEEYRRLFRKACAYLPTGSKLGGWQGKSTKNDPFKAAIKDANFKNSKSSYFVQIADLVAYATLVKARKELGRLSDREKEFGWGDIHDAIPRDTLNRKASWRKDGIVALKAKSAA